MECASEILAVENGANSKINGDVAADLYPKARRSRISREMTTGLLGHLAARPSSCGGAGSLLMNLAACVNCVLILDDPAVLDREHALGLIVDHMAASGLFPRSVAPEILASIMRREELGPTGIGEGVAIPHTWHPAIDRTMGRWRFRVQGWNSRPWTMSPCTLSSCS